MATPRAKPTDEMRNTRARKNAYITMRKANTAALASEEATHSTTRIATESALASDRRSRATRSAVTGAAISTATPSGGSNLIMTTIFLMVGLIVVYMLVTNPGPTSGLFGTLGNSLHALSSNKPLFTSVPVTSASNPNATPVNVTGTLPGK
jgi:hypothetical protein